LCLLCDLMTRCLYIIISYIYIVKDDDLYLASMTSEDHVNKVSMGNHCNA